jgi:hypothetical protein
MSPDSTGPELPSGALFSPLLEAAVRLAARGHYHQFRKNLTDEEGETPGGDFLPDRVPYIAHLMGTMCILARVGVRDEVLAAAILHDYLEDVPDPDGRESIRASLGEEVLSLVLEVTEHKRREFDEADTWDIRKREQLDHLEMLADLDAAEDAASVWQPFNAGPERQLWYFTGVVEAVERRLGDHPLARELRATVDRLQPLVTE